MIPIAIVNGIFREKFLASKFSETRAHQFSTIILICILTLYIFTALSIFPLKRLYFAVTVGLFWSLLTIFFELFLGRLLAQRTWKDLLYDYNIFTGRIWILVPLTLFLIPIVMYF